MQSSVVIKFLLCLLAFTISLENFFDKTIGIDTPATPYRMVTIILLFFLVLKGGFKSLNVNKANVLILLVFIWGVIAAIFWYFKKDVEFGLLITNFILFFINYLMFIAIHNVFKSRDDVRLIFIYFNLGLLLNFLLILSEGYTFNSQVSYVRVSGFFTNPNNLALACLFGLTTSFYLFHTEKKILFRICAIGFIGISLFLINVTASRAGAIVGVLLVPVLVIWYFRTNSTFVGKLMAIVSIVIVFFVYESLSINAINRQNSREQRNVKEERNVLTAAGIEAFIQSNFIGLGLGQFKSIINFYPIVYKFSPSIALDRQRKNEGLVTHNSYIQILAETGIVGFLLLVSFWIIKLKTLLKNRKIKEDVFWFQSCIAFILIVYSFAHVTFLAPTFWFFIAFISPLNRIAENRWKS
jgi:O-antigen ligase